MLPSASGPSRGLPPRVRGDRLRLQFEPRARVGRLTPTRERGVNDAIWRRITLIPGLPPRALPLRGYSPRAWGERVSHARPGAVQRSTPAPAGAGCPESQRRNCPETPVYLHLRGENNKDLGEPRCKSGLPPRLRGEGCFLGGQRVPTRSTPTRRRGESVVAAIGAVPVRFTPTCVGRLMLASMARARTPGLSPPARGVACHRRQPKTCWSTPVYAGCASQHSRIVPSFAVYPQGPCLCETTAHTRGVNRGIRDRAMLTGGSPPLPRVAW